MKAERKVKEESRPTRRDERQGTNRKEWEGQTQSKHKIYLKERNCHTTYNEHIPVKKNACFFNPLFTFILPKIQVFMMVVTIKTG